MSMARTLEGIGPQARSSGALFNRWRHHDIWHIKDWGWLSQTSIISELAIHAARYSTQFSGVPDAAANQNTRC